MSTYEKFFSKCLAKYTYPQIVRRDVTSALETYKELRPKFEDFIHNDGTSRKLVSLDGTIPVRYMGSTYNIPIAIFLFESYPHKSPMVYVRPTNTMQIKPSDFVDSAGLVQLPYMTDWKHPDADLIGLISVLQIVFGETSPVFSKSAPISKRQSLNPQLLPQCIGPMPYPSTLPQPPIPVTPNGQASNMYLPQLGTGWQIPGSVPIPPNLPMPQLPSFATPFTQTANPNMYPMPMPVCPDVSTSSNMPYNTGTLNEEQLKLSVLTAVADQVRRVQKELIYQHQDDLQAIRQTQTGLFSGGQKIQEMINKMQQEKDRVCTEMESVKRKIKDLKETSEKLRKSDSTFVIDEAFDTTAPLYRQLVVSFAEEQAIEDAIYYLGEAMGKNVLDVEIYLKKVRELSRRQFMLRATVQKCREKAGLPTL
ncbi:hypothetical protein MN116_000838 [Schistosoma mekongi]|uniref:Tumor susceptibility gene 101 protein n=1 Tax=Schistosoma mekongi TaxID=38744 RepID=A0AAE1ZLH5_SCHME|nr:hypothetical protein MN116_000838 [Schistosoma mekongi]